ncbi:MAG: argininosuccinate lyase, partial [bacterium]
RLDAAADDRFLAATDLADVLAAEGVPFRVAHGIVEGLVRRALEEGRPFEEMYGEALSDLPSEARSRVEDAMSDRDVIDSKVSYGGTGATRVAEQIALAKQELEALEPSARD